MRSYSGYLRVQGVWCARCATNTICVRIWKVLQTNTFMNDSRTNAQVH